jgi:transcriptional antiterminator RfaH
MVSRWYVAQTQIHAENKAAAHLVRQGFDVYLPRYQKRRRHARRTEIVPAPLFPRYLFVAVDMEMQRWRSIHSTYGITRLIRNGDEPAAVPDSVIAALRAREGENGFIEFERRRFLPGGLVQIKDGAFASCLGLIEGIRDEERVTVLLDLLGRKVRVNVDELSLAAA